ncbi:MAG: class I SAM-dependent methyltransferase [Acidobacteriota bacterium]
MSSIQQRAEVMIDAHGFLGVPRETFEAGGRAQLVRLLEHGLLPESKVLDIGCGCLRVAYWLVRFLDQGCYCGIEPARERVEAGRRHLFEPAELERARPRFDFNERFDTSVFSETFDFFLAGSIWTHCSKASVELTLDGFAQHTTPNGVFLVSYLPATSAEDDYQGDTWVGTSHVSTEPGVIRHARSWILDACTCRGFAVTELPGLDCDSQPWLRLDKTSRA